jgi:hypothetical protein
MDTADGVRCSRSAASDGGSIPLFRYTNSAKSRFRKSEARRGSLALNPNANETPTARLREPAKVMRLERMRSFHQICLSFMRTLLRRLERERWSIERPLWRIGATGEGVAVYRARGPKLSYSLICFAHHLEPEERTDRVIAERWDTTFTLMNGDPSEADLKRLAANVPLQEAGRCSERELVLFRANKSVRLFEHVVERPAVPLPGSTSTWVVPKTAK